MATDCNWASSSTGRRELHPLEDPSARHPLDDYDSEQHLSDDNDTDCHDYRDYDPHYHDGDSDCHDDRDYDSDCPPFRNDHNDNDRNGNDYPDCHNHSDYDDPHCNDDWNDLSAWLVAAIERYDRPAVCGQVCRHTKRLGSWRILRPHGPMHFFHNPQLGRRGALVDSID